MIEFLADNGCYIINMAQRRLSEGANVCAVECCNRVLELNKNVFEAHFIKGCALYNMGEYGLSETEFLSAVKYMPLAVGCYANLAMAAVKSRDSSIVNMIDNALNMVKADAQLHMMCGILYADIGEYDEAFRQFNEAHRLRPSMEAVYINAGCVMLERADAEESDLRHAVCCFTTALKLSPLNKYAYYNRCKAYIRLNMGQEALQDADTLLFIDRNDAGYYYIYARALELLGQYSQAVKNYEIADSFGDEYVSTESKKRIARIFSLGRF